jgi:3-deoxy-D-manno-octulosonic-acid transferase
VIVPRHPERGADIAKAMDERWLVPARRSAGDTVSAKVDVYIADTLGELGLFYRLADVVFVGGSLVDVGGHNPVEPAHLDCAILHGPQVTNFQDMYAAFDAAGGAVAVATAGELATRMVDLLADEAKAKSMAAANRGEIARHTGTLERALEALAPILAG